MVAPPLNEPSGIARNKRPRWRASGLVWLLPVLVGFANLILILAKLPNFLSILYLSSDTASAPVIASLAAVAPADRLVTLGNYPWYETYWFLQATLHFPAHRTIWEIAPVLWTGAAFVLIARTIWTTFGRWAAGMTVAVFCSVTRFQQAVFFTLDTHGLLLVHASVLIFAIVWLVRRDQDPTWRTWSSVGVPLTAFTALSVASDPLSYLANIFPFLAAALFSYWKFGTRRHRNIAVFAITTSVIAAVTGEVAAAAMRAVHVTGTPLRVDFVAPGNLFPNLNLFATAYTNLAGGDFFGLPLNRANVFTFAAGMLSLVALALVIRWAWKRTPQALKRVRSTNPTQEAQFAFAVFWSALLVAMCAAFILTSTPQDALAGRYIATAYVAVAVLLPLCVSKVVRAPRQYLAVAIGLFAAVTFVGNVLQPAADSTFLQVGLPAVAPPVAAEVEHFSLSHDARFGYAPYWDAAALSWASQLRLQVYPVYECQSPALTLCSYFLNEISTWYKPRPNTRTFLITDVTVPDPVSLDPALGKPIASKTFGNVTVYIWGHDIASAIKGPN
jgi:hypothetical protein